MVLSLVIYCGPPGLRLRPFTAARHTDNSRSESPICLSLMAVAGDTSPTLSAVGMRPYLIPPLFLFFFFSRPRSRFPRPRLSLTSSGKLGIVSLQRLILPPVEIGPPVVKTRKGSQHQRPWDTHGQSKIDNALNNEKRRTCSCINRI